MASGILWAMDGYGYSRAQVPQRFFHLGSMVRRPLRPVVVLFKGSQDPKKSQKSVWISMDLLGATHL